MMFRRFASVIGSVVLLTFSVIAPVAAADPPDLTKVVTQNSTIRQGFEKRLTVEVFGFEAGGTFLVSGSGVELILPNGGIKPTTNPDQYRLKFAATEGAALGLRDLTVINPDGQSDTLADAIEVIPSGVVPATGVSGHVFSDLNGDGIKDATDVGLSGVAVSVVDSAGTTLQGATDTSGNYTLTGLAPGDSTVTYTTPTDYTITTLNDVQIVTVVDMTVTAAVDVGYEPPEGGGGTVDILGFSNPNANISQGEVRSYLVNVTGADAAATWTISGGGVTVSRAVLRGDTVRMTVVATADAALGLRDLTVVNPDGSTDTLQASLEVVGS